MSPRIARRCTAISLSLAIVILLTASPTNGFTLHRNQENVETESTADLAVAESTLLEVKNDLNRPNDIKTSKVGKHEGSDKTQTTDSFRNKITAEDGNSKSKQRNKGNNSRETSRIVPEITTHYTKGNPNIHITILDFKSSPEVVTTDTSNGGGSKTLLSTRNPIPRTSALNSAKQTGITSLLPIKENTKTESSYTSTQLTSVSAPNTASSGKDELTTISISGDYNSQGTTIFNSLGAEVNTLQDSTSIDDFTYSTESENQYNQTYLNTKSTNSNIRPSDVTNASIETTKNISENKTKSTIDITPTKAIAAEEITKTINELSTTIDFKSSIIDLIPILNADTNLTTETNIPSKKNTREKDNVITSEEPFITTTEPAWRKYTIIDRKRLTTHEVTTVADIEKMTKAETAQTRISLEQALAVTPIASLERLREDLIANRNRLAAIQGSSRSTDWTSTHEVETTSSIPSLKKTGAKVGMVSSMRAGFLDYSGKATTSESSTTTEDYTSTYATAYGRDGGGMDRLTNKYVESQSQLAEDAIKEELLKEEMLNDNLANAHRYRDDRADTEGVGPLTSDVRNAQDSQSYQTENKTTLEDALGVQPISQEQGKNIDLYAVSPNYKPMKRIEVQPAKPFVRDPDDNSWRNESISSLGIVFKPKNSSKSFTQVLKNKTENVLNSLADRDSKNGVPDLRERLEKIAEVRKSKKKRINKFGDTVYTDYEETSGSGESYTTPKSAGVSAISEDNLLMIITPTIPSISGLTVSQGATEISKDKNVSEKIPTPMGDLIKQNDPETLTTPKTKKLFNIAEYYDTTDEYDADYLTLSKIDLKKFTVPTQETTISPPTESFQTKQISPYPPDRKPTIQYFPPRVVPKVSVHDYDENFNRKVNQYTLKDIPKTPVVTTYKPIPLEPILKEKQIFTEKFVKPKLPLPNRDYNLNKIPYISSAPPLPEQNQGFVGNNGDFNRASYVIKHYGDFINEAAKDDDDRNSDYVVLTEPPIRGITVDELAKLPTAKPVTTDDDYDYETQFRKDILNRFVENFNQNSERFKVDFPVLYNNSVVHRKVYDDGRGVASSSAFMKRLYNDAAANKPNYLFVKKTCDPNCDKITVELSPAYELHYYVPDQEEKEVMDPRMPAPQYRLRL